MKPNFFIIFSAYNEESTIGEVITGVKKQAKNIIVVDDGSTDQTGKIAQKFEVVYLRHKINIGKGAAMKTGAEAAFNLGAESIIFMDADGQHEPKYIPEFLKNLSMGYEIVFGSRNLYYGVPLVRFLGNKFGSILINLIFGIYRSDLLCGFIAMTKKAYTKIKWDSPRYGVETEIVAKTGKNRLKYIEVPIGTIYRDRYKGVTIFDAVGILLNIPKWLFS